ncbi:SEC-C motif domain protein [uncultured Gammaproteobacteria bacterium]
MTMCPCGSGRSLDDCCGPLIAGGPAPTAEALMRSRYTAFTQRALDYLDQTNAPETRDSFERAEADNIGAESEWISLEIRALSGGCAGDDTGTVEFVARFKYHGKQFAHHERASFRHDGERWWYVDGEINPKGPPRQVVKVGRNDPCPCGSGKKHKKCCGT